MKYLLFFISITVLISSCSSIRSNINISPKHSFTLGDNKHGAFKVALQNNSDQEIEVYQRLVGGKNQAPIKLSPKESISVKIPSNTAVIIDNKNAQEVTVSAKITGDIGLSMGYKN